MEKARIEKFFRKACTPEEAAEVALYLKANPLVLEEYLGEEEFKRTGKQLMPGAFWNEVWENIEGANKKQPVNLMRAVAVAASFILIFMAIWLLYSKQPRASKKVAAAAVKKSPPKFNYVTNTTNGILKIVLEDSSIIKLSPASSVQYASFAGNRRDIYLEGEADFKVSKNKQKPFTVYAGVLATTALGTIFSVKKNNDKNTIAVKLFEGKVLIHAAGNDLAGWNKDVYLAPGEQLVFNTAQTTAIVKKFSRQAPVTAALKKSKPQTDSVSSELNFNNESLPAVMQKLSAYYHVEIRYDTLLLSTMNFTGTVSRNDPPEIILKAIGQMNGLDILKNNNEFIITNHQP